MDNDIIRWSLEDIGNTPWVPNTPVLDERITHNVTMDVGSTSERTLLYDENLTTMSDLLVVDSGYHQLDRPITHVRSASTNMNDNLEIIITPHDKTHLIGTEVHIIKGTLRKAINESFIPMSSNASKIDQAPTYVNIYANLGIALLYQMHRMEKVFKDNRVKFTVALPTEDLDNQTRIDTFLQKLCGDFTIEFPRLNVKFDLKVAKSDVIVASEIEAVMYYYFGKHSRNADDNILFIEGGGRNISYSVIKEGIINHDSALSRSNGGSLLNNLLSKQLSQELGITKPRLEIMEQVLCTGVLKVGGATKDALQCVNNAKEEFSKAVFAGLMHAIDNAGLQAMEISKIVCDGRIFKEIRRDGRVVSRSLMSIIEDQFKTVSPDTQFEYTNMDYPVPEGLVSIRIEEEVQM